jgi:hypothetical protein
MRFFLIKEPKTSHLGLEVTGWAEAKWKKVFCFFFSKKKCFLPCDCRDKGGAICMMTTEQLAWLNEALGFDHKAASAPPPAPPPQTPGNSTLYLKEPGDKTDVSDTDINQGYIGDCYLLSSIGEIARISPATIKKMIKDNGNGTYTVTLYQKQGGFWAGVKEAFGADPEFKPVQVTVDANFPAGGSVNPQPGQDVVEGKKEIWPQIIEKAYAQLHGGYAGIKDGGHANEAMEGLTGKPASEKSSGGLFGVGLQDLLDAFKGGKPIVMNTPEKPNLPFNLVPGHAYMLEDIAVDQKGGATIKLRNPWGNTQLQPPMPIPFDRLSTGIDSVDIGGALPPEPK